jgi:plastocyanin
MRLSRPFRIATFVIAIAALAPSVAQATSQVVVIKNFAFMPTPATINVGESVTWLNNDLFNHTVTSDTGAFDKPVAAGGNVTVSFAVAGTYAYHCSIHPTMQGTIVVLGPTSTPAPPTPTPRPTPPPTAPPPTESPSPSPSPSSSPTPSPSASPSPPVTPTPPASATGTPITVPTSVAQASPSAAVGPGPDLAGGPGPIIAAGALLLAVALGGSAVVLYRRR